MPQAAADDGSDTEEKSYAVDWRKIPAQEMRLAEHEYSNLSNHDQVNNCALLATLRNSRHCRALGTAS